MRRWTCLDVVAVIGGLGLLAMGPVAARAQAAAAASTLTCRTESGREPPAVVELYTSEGCSSCPPADRWASMLKGRRDVVVLAFHVNYWDKLGWPDRFATAANTERQRMLQRAMGAAFVYTPQVVHNGRDLRDWANASLTPLAPGPVQLALERDGDTVRAFVGAADAPRRVAGYWAVLEDGQHSRVRAGENAGETLTHDHVVTRYQPVDAWPTAQPQRFTLALAPERMGASATRRRVAFVVTDEDGARPLQALALGC